MTETTTIDRTGPGGADVHAMYPDYVAHDIQGGDIQVGDVFPDGSIVTGTSRHDNPNYSNDADRPLVAQCSKVAPDSDHQPQPSEAEKRPRFIPPKLQVRVFRKGGAPAPASTTTAQEITVTAEDTAPNTAAIQGIPSTPAAVEVIDIAEHPIECICGKATTLSHKCHGGGYTCQTEGSTRDLRPYGHDLDTHACDAHWAEFVAKQPAPAVPIPAAEPVQPPPPAVDPADEQLAELEDPTNAPVDPEDPATLVEPSDTDAAPVISADDLKKLKQSTKRLAKKYADWVELGDDGISIISKVRT